MYSRGLQTFLELKKLKSKECIDKFLQQEGITSFSSIHHNRVNDFIDKNWTKFASFVDRGIKSGDLQGQAVRLNFSYEEDRQRKEIVKSEINAISPEMKNFINIIRKYDKDFMRLSSCTTFFSKNGENLPKNNSEAESRIAKNLPKIEFMFNHPLKEDLINYLIHLQK